MKYIFIFPPYDTHEPHFLAVSLCESQHNVRCMESQGQIVFDEVDVFSLSAFHSLGTSRWFVRVFL